MSAKLKLPPKTKRGAMVAAAAAALMTALPSTVEALADQDSFIVEAQPKLPARRLRTYQLPMVQDQHTKVLILECSRQIGKSHGMGDWIGLRLMKKLQTANDWLIVVISNSRANGIELGGKAAAVMRDIADADEKLRGAEIVSESPESVDYNRDPELGPQSGVPDLEVSDYSQRIEVRIGNRRGRIIILAASPRTARGFSADLVLDEFAFHENAAAIWDAAYPMLDSNPDFLCRICSTHNGIGSLFNTWIKGKVFPVYSVKRSEAWRMGRGDEAAMRDFYAKWRSAGPRSAAQADAWFATHGLTPRPWDKLKIMSLRSQDEQGNQRELTPEEAEEESTNKASYRQNYENDPADEGGAFLTWEWITRAERAPLFRIDKQSWSTDTLQRLYRMKSEGWEFYIGQDFARTTDLSAVNVLACQGSVERQVAQLEMRGVTSPEQRRQMEALLEVIGAKVGCVAIDSTGPGLGLAEELADKFGSLILLVNFAQTVPMDTLLAADGRTAATMGIPERMAEDLRRSFEDGRIEIITDPELRDDLRKPCRVFRNNKVSVAAARTPADHADRFWSLALALHGKLSAGLGGWSQDDLAGAMVPANNISTMPAYHPPGMGFFLP